MHYGKLKADTLFNCDNKINFFRQQLFEGRPADEMLKQQHMSCYPLPPSGLIWFARKPHRRALKIQLEKRNISGKLYGCGKWGKKICSESPATVTRSFVTYSICQIIPECNTIFFSCPAGFPECTVICNISCNNVIKCSVFILFQTFFITQKKKNFFLIGLIMFFIDHEVLLIKESVRLGVHRQWKMNLMLSKPIS